MSAEITLPVGQQNQNIVRLATAQALAGANSVVFYATGAIVGNAIAPSPTLATLPITIFVLGMAACILPFGALARRRGRKTVFMVGTGAGVLTGRWRRWRSRSLRSDCSVSRPFSAAPMRRWRCPSALPLPTASAASGARGRSRWSWAAAWRRGSSARCW